MQFLWIPYFAALNRLRGWSLVDHYDRKYQRINPITGVRIKDPKWWERVVDVFASKIAVSLYLILPILLFLGFSSYQEAGIKAVAYWVLFVFGWNAGFQAIHGFPDWPEGSGNYHKELAPLKWIMREVCQMDPKRHGHWYGVVYMTLRWSLFGLPLLWVFLYYDGIKAVVLLPALLLAGITLWLAGRISQKYAIPIWDIMQGAVMGTGAAIIW